jgi:GTP:adenosylcobinamide-phosphate guanylyltransferase
MLDLAGKPMIQWVLDAISKSPKINHIIVIGLTELGGITCPKPITFLANQKDMLANINTGLDALKRFQTGSEYALLAASDVPGITTEMVNWMVDAVESSPADIYYQVITREAMEEKFPTSRRTYTHIKDMEICGGDVNAVRVNLDPNVNHMWERLIASRKNPIKQASILGLNVLSGLLFRSATIDELAEMICKRLKIIGKVVRCPYAEMGMDVDKPHQLEIMRHFLSRRSAA